MVIRISEDQKEFILNCCTCAFNDAAGKKSIVVCAKYTNTDVEGVYDVEFAKMYIPHGQQQTIENHMNGYIFKFKE